MDIMFEHGASLGTGEPAQNDEPEVSSQLIVEISADQTEQPFQVFNIESPIALMVRRGPTDSGW
jgi:hypothetical protein